MAEKRIKVYEDDDGDWRWTKWQSSDKVANSGEGYTSKSYAISRALAEADEDTEVYLVDEDGETLVTR